jgi:K+ transporter
MYLRCRDNSRPLGQPRCAPASRGLAFDMMDTSFFVGKVTIMPDRNSRLGVIRTNLFEAMHRQRRSEASVPMRGLL